MRKPTVTLPLRFTDLPGLKKDGRPQDNEPVLPMGSARRPRDERRSPPRWYSVAERACTLLAPRGREGGEAIFDCENYSAAHTEINAARNNTMLTTVSCTMTLYGIAQAHRPESCARTRQAARISPKKQDGRPGGG